jgi:hypothetical protein
LKRLKISPKMAASICQNSQTLQVLNSDNSCSTKFLYQNIIKTFQNLLIHVNFDDWKSLNLFFFLYISHTWYIPTSIILQFDNRINESSFKHTSIPSFFWLKVFLSKFVWPPFRKAEAKTQHYLIFRAVGNEEADDLTLFQTGGRLCPPHY